MRKVPRPEHAVVLRIITEESARLGASVTDVIHMATDDVSISARAAAMARILDETGCSKSGLAEVWGCDRQIPGRLVRPRGPSRRGWRTADARPGAEADREAWQALGRGVWRNSAHAHAARKAAREIAR